MPGRRALLIVAALVLGAAPARAAAPSPIAQDPVASAGLPGFVGSPAIPHGLYEPPIPRHPFMAANGRSELHDDAYQSDTYPGSGPLGRSVAVLSTSLGGDCASVTFDRQGRLLTVCVGPLGPTLYLLDPSTLSTLASMALPPKPVGTASTNPFQDFTGGGYFYLDNQDRVVVPTTTRHVEVIAETAGAGGPGFAVQHDYDLSTVLASGDRITSALPSWDGHLVFESFNGVVGTIDPANGAVRTLPLGEETENSFAIDETGGIYVVSTQALYRLDLAADGSPRVSWRAGYPNSGVHKPGQVDAGSGTTPTVQGPYVTITDNADPLDVVVFRRARTVTGSRLVCVQPVFGAGAGADENSVIGSGNLMVVENNYGYTGPTATTNGGTTAPGVARVDINPDGSGCHKVWENDSVSIPTAVSKVSLAAGLVYGYTKDTDPRDPWWFAALDLGSGRLDYRALAGTGTGFNNNYAPITLGPDGSAYVGALQGLVEIHDAVPPRVPLAQPPLVVVPRPHLRLVVRALRGRRVRVRLTGATGTVQRVIYRAAGRARVARTPFALTLRVARARPGRRLLIRAVVSVRGRPAIRLIAAVRVRR